MLGIINLGQTLPSGVKWPPQNGHFISRLGNLLYSPNMDLHVVHAGAR